MLAPPSEWCCHGEILLYEIFIILAPPSEWVAPGPIAYFYAIEISDRMNIYSAAPPSEWCCDGATLHLYAIRLN